MRWTLDQLRTLVAVADEGTMSGAAASLGYTTGAVSQQMAALGRAVGRTLFVRDGVRLVLSDDGRVLLEQARLVLEAERRAAAVVRGPSPAAAVRLGVFGSAAVVGLPAAQVLLADDPTVALQAVEVDVEAMPDAVLRDEIDLALGLDYSDAPLPPRRGLDVARLHRERFLLVLPPGGGADLTSAEEVRAYGDATDWILPPATSTFGRAVRAACARAGIAPRERHLVTDTAVSIALAEAGRASPWSPRSCWRCARRRPPPCPCPDPRPATSSRSSGPPRCSGRAWSGCARRWSRRSVARKVRQGCNAAVPAGDEGVERQRVPEPPSRHSLPLVMSPAAARPCPLSVSKRLR